MKTKKTKKADLEHKRAVLFPIGLAVAATITLTAFEWVQVEARTFHDRSEKDSEMAFDPVYKEEQPKEKEVIDVQPKPKKFKQNQNDNQDHDVQANVIANAETEETSNPEEANDMEMIDPGAEFGGIDIGHGSKPDITLTVDEFKLTEPAKYKGGFEAMYAFLGKNITYPREAKMRGKKGKIFVEFIVDTEGNVGSVKVLGDPFDQSCAREAVSAVQKMPQWIPGEQYGKKVNVRFRIPVDFRLE